MRARYIVLEPCGDNLWSLTLHGTAKEAVAQVNESGGLLVRPIPLTVVPRRRRATAEVRRPRIELSPNGHAARRPLEHP